MRSKSVSKRIIAIILIIVLVFGGINLFWYGFKYLPFKKIADKMQLNGDPEMPRYVCEYDGYVFRVKMPGYLSFQTGFIYAVDKDHVDAAAYIEGENGELVEMNTPHVDLFAWPQVFGDTEYGVTIYEDTYSVWAGTNLEEEFLPDESMTDEENALAAELFEKHRSEIHDVMQAAAKFCGW